MATFLDELNRLNTQNFLGGLAVAGQAVKEQAQNENVKQLYDKFKANQSGLPTTDETVNELNKSLSELNTTELNDTQAFANKFADMSGKVANNYMKMMKKVDLYDGAYSPIILGLAANGSKEALDLANTLSGQLQKHKDQIEKEAQIPLKTIEFNNAMQESLMNKLQIQTGQIKLDELKRDINVKDTLNKMMQTDIAKQVFTFDEASGRGNFDSHKTYLTFKKLFGNDPNFGRAWLLFEDFVKDKTFKYDSSKGLEARLKSQLPSDADVAFITAYDNAAKMSKHYGELTIDANWYGLRDSFYREAEIYLNAHPELKSKYRTAKDIPLGSIPQINERVGTNDKVAGKELDWIHNHFFDSTNEDTYYWNYINLLSRKQGKPISYLDKIDVRGATLPMSILLLNTPARNEFTVSKDGKPEQVNVGGWWNPYDPANNERYDNVQYNIKAKREQKETKQSKDLQQKSNQSFKGN